MLHHLAESDPNKLTLDSYNAEVLGYIKHTPASYRYHHTPMLTWIDRSLALLPRGACILEIGSGTGREAQYIKSKGYQITCSDGAYAFVDYLKRAGWAALHINVLRDAIPEKYDMILANAVLPHFTPRQFEYTLIKIMNSLKPGGLFAFSVKQGVGEKWITEKFDAKRFIHYWDPADLRRYIQEAGCEVIFWQEGIPGDLPTHTWTNVTIRRIIPHMNGMAKVTPSFDLR